MAADLDIKSNLNSSNDFYNGVQNLLNNAVNAKPGETILIVGESGPTAHFDEKICEKVALIAGNNGLDVDIVFAKVGSSANDFPDSVSHAMRKVDHTLFFSRLGDQIRFCNTPGKGSKTMSYTPNIDYLASNFAQVPFELTRQIHNRVVEKITTSKSFCLHCPDGTRLTGDLNELDKNAKQLPDLSTNLFTDFSVSPFPLGIFPPVSAMTMSGRLILQRWLTSSSTISYDNSVFPIPEPVTAIVDKGKITRFEGNADVCQSVENHLYNVAQIVGGEATIINSWHTGIIPSTWYKGRGEDDLERWGNVTFCSPRFTHFHACGSDPGHVAISLFDASIWFDDELMWDRGQFIFPRSSACIDVFDNYKDWLQAYQHNGDIGLPGAFI